MIEIDIIKPVYYVSDENKELIKKIEEKLSIIDIDNNIKKKNMRIKSKVRSIYSSLAIEANSLSIESIENIIDNKMVLGDRREIQEVKNANYLYDNMDNYDWKSEKDFIKAHTLLMKYFEDDNGYYRNHGEGFKRGNEVIYTAPNSLLVPNLMKSLFEFININELEIHPLVLSSIFHYYFVYIHPFSDGNGRMARFWVSLILTDWNYLFKYIPIEEEIYINQREYYDSISKCHINGNVNEFINFMLKIVYLSLEKTTQKTTQKKLNKNQVKMLELIKNNSKITRKEMAFKLNITEDGVKYNLKKLIDNGHIERIGPDNGGYWRVK